MGRPGLTRPLRIALFGDGRWAAEAVRGLGDGPHQVVAVISRTRPSDASLAGAACEWGIPVLTPANVNSSEFLRELESLAPDLGLSIAYDQILAGEILAVPPLGCINVHAGMLPSYRGRNVINWAIINGEREVGVTAHVMDQGIDTGDILVQRGCPIGWTDTYGDVLGRVIEVVPSVVEEAVTLLAAGRGIRRPQSGPGTYFGARVDGDEWLDWTDNSTNLHNKVRGITRPGPGARTLWRDQVITVWRAHFDPGWPRYIATPGQVVGRRPGEGVMVKTSDSTLLIQEIEMEGSAPMPPAWPVGTRLGLDLGRAVRALMARVSELEARQTQRSKS